MFSIRTELISLVVVFSKLLIKKDIIVNHRDDFDSNCEILWAQCQVQSKKSKSILLGSFYRPHLSNMASLIELDVSLSKIGNLINTTTVILGGDFNALNISWENNQVLIHQATQKKFWAQIKHLKKDDPGVLKLMKT